MHGDSTLPALVDALERYRDPNGDWAISVTGLHVEGTVNWLQIDVAGTSSIAVVLRVAGHVAPAEVIAAIRGAVDAESPPHVIHVGG